MSKEPITRFGTNNIKLRKTLQVLLACCTPFLLLIFFALPNVKTGSEEESTTIFLMMFFVFAAPAAYIGYSKWAPTKVYSPQEIETWFNSTRLAKVLTFLRGVLSYWRTLFGFFIIGIWVLVMLWDFVFK